jgi:hypothetical protein
MLRGLRDLRVNDVQPGPTLRCVIGAAILAASTLSSGCLVLALHPSYDGDSIAWDPALVGTWRDAEDRMSLAIGAAEWRSYRIHYEHPSEKGDLTAYLTIVGDERYLDVLPLRGIEYGSFLLPVHAVLRLTLDGDRLVLTPLSYDWFADRLRSGRGAGLPAVLDQKQNALLSAPTARLRSWLRALPVASPVWGAAATFTREKDTAGKDPAMDPLEGIEGASR